MKRPYDKIFFDFNDGMQDDGTYRVVLPKYITIGDSELEVDGRIELVIDHNDACCVLSVRPTGKYYDLIPRKEADMPDTI